MRGGCWILFALLMTIATWESLAKSLPKNAPRPSKDELATKLYRMAHHPKTKGAVCVACKVIVDGVQILLKQNKTEEEIENFIVNTCETLRLEDNYVCQHFVNEFADEGFFVLERVIFTAEEICGAFIDDCGVAHNPLIDMWNLTIPGNKPKVRAWPTVEEGKPTLKILHLSDIHVDRHYLVGGEADCSKGHPLYEFCCIQFPDGSGTATKVNVPAGKWGMPYLCDIPYITFEALIKQIAEREQLDYVYVTGDMEAHNIWDYTKADTAANLRNITGIIHKYFPNTPVFEAVGNHEGVPMDAIAPHGMEEYEERNPQWLYNTLAENWQPWIGASQIETVKYRGSYSIKLKNKLKLISLNNIYGSLCNLYTYLDQVDPDGTLKWLIQELMASEQLKEKVHIISHIPPGNIYCLKGWSHNFYKIVNRFENTIAGMFWGHTHYDHFEVYYENFDINGRATHVNYIAPSLTTYDYNNPAYRIYTVDGDYSGSSFTVIDTDTYSADILKANAEDRAPTWEHTYSAKKDYGMTDLSPASWSNLIHRMEQNNDLFEQFLWNYRRSDYELADCGPACKKKFLCEAKSAMSYSEDLFCPEL